MKEHGCKTGQDANGRYEAARLRDRKGPAWSVQWAAEADASLSTLGDWFSQGVLINNTTSQYSRSSLNDPAIERLLGLRSSSPAWGVPFLSLCLVPAVSQD